MDIQKLFDALSDLRQQRAGIDKAIHHLEFAISALSQGGDAAPTASSGGGELSNIDKSALPENTKMRHGSYFESVFSVLSKLAAPLAINDLQRYVENMTGRKVSRATLEGLISRHIRIHGDESLIIRVRPGVYGLRDKSRYSVPPPTEQ